MRAVVPQVSLLESFHTNSTLRSATKTKGALGSTPIWTRQWRIKLKISN